MRLRPSLIGVALLAGSGCLYAATINHEFPTGDERLRYDLARLVAQRGPGLLGGSGSLCLYPPLTSIVAAPLVAAFGRLDDPGGDVWARRGAAATSALVAALAVLALYGLARAIGYESAVAGRTAALFAVASPLWPYSKRFYSEPLSALLVLAAGWGLARTRASPRSGLAVLIGAVALLGHNNWFVAAVTGIAALIVLGTARRWRHVAVAATGFTLGASIVFAVQVWRFGRFTVGYGAGQDFTFRLADSIPGLLFGPGRSVFLFAPTALLGLAGLVLAWRRGERDSTRFVAAATGGLFLVVASWWAWYGGMCFGPRLLLPVVPLASVFLAELIARGAWKWPIRIGVAFGVYVQLVGVSLVHDYDIFLWLAPDTSNERLAWFSPSHTPLFRVPIDVARSPWDVSSDFLLRTDRDRTVVHGDGRPVQHVEIEQSGQSILHAWSVSDVVVEAGDRRRRAHELGARFAPTGTVAGTPGGENAVDADPETRWTSGAYRRPGMAVRIDLGAALAVDRLELIHAPFRDDFPSAVVARGSEDGVGWRPLSVVAGTPRLGFKSAFYLLLAAGLALLALAYVASSFSSADPPRAEGSDDRASAGA